MDVLKIKDLRWGNIHIGGKKEVYLYLPYAFVEIFNGYS